MEEVSGLAPRARVTTNSLSQVKHLASSLPDRATTASSDDVHRDVGSLGTVDRGCESAAFIIECTPWWNLLQSLCAMRLSDHRGLADVSLMATSLTALDDKDVAFQTVHTSLLQLRGSVTGHTGWAPMKTLADCPCECSLPAWRQIVRDVQK